MKKAVVLFARLKGCNPYWWCAVKPLLHLKCNKNITFVFVVAAAMLSISAAYAVVRCPSVCHVRVLCQNG